MALSDWSYEKTVAAPATIRIKYTSPSGVEKEAVLTSTTWSETTSKFIGLTWYDDVVSVDGQLYGTKNTEYVVDSRNSFTRSTVAAVNGAYVKWCLENEGALPVGDANRESETSYEYAQIVTRYTTGDSVRTGGPRLFRETTKEYISGFEFAGSLNITDYKGVLVTGLLIHTSTTVTTYDEYTSSEGRTHTKVSTSRYMALGLTQEGQQSAAEQLALEDGTGRITNEIVVAMQELVYDGTEVRSSIGRAALPTGPAPSDTLDNYINDPENYSGDFGFGSGADFGSGSSYSSGESGSSYPIDENYNSGGNSYQPGATYAFSTSITLQFQSSQGTSCPSGRIRTDNYSMPFNQSPVVYSTGFVDESRRQLAARAYGFMVHSLKSGYAFGFNVTTSADLLPSVPFAPLFINEAGISVATRTNGTSWAFDENGIVVSSDLLLCGVAGAIEPVTSSWVRLPVDPSQLPILDPAVTAEDPAPAGTITAPEGFDPLNPGDIFTSLPTTETDTPTTSQTVNGVVAPYLVTEPLQGRSRHRLVIVDFSYALNGGSETVELRSRHMLAAQEVVLLQAPALEVQAEVLPPSAGGGAAVIVPGIEVETDLAAVIAGGGAAVLVPGLEVEAESIAPIVPRDQLAIMVPGIEVEAEVLPPAVARSAAVVVPAVEVEAETVAPRAGGNLGDIYGLTALIEDNLLELL